MKYLGKWLFVYSVFGVLSALIGYAVETKGELSGEWWLALMMLPITTILTFFTLGFFYKGLGTFILASGSAVFIVASIGYAIKRSNIWLYGLALGSAIVCWQSVTIFFVMMSV